MLDFSKPEISLSRPMFKKPFILFMGPQKTATSWIDAYLRTRHEACMPRQIKEISFFNKRYERGPGFYRRHFKIKPEHIFTAEVTTELFADPDAPSRVCQTLGRNIRLICTLRHPVSRSYSLYMHLKRYGQARGSFRDACRENPLIIESSRYAMHLERWYQYFPPQKMFFLFQETLREDPESFLRQLCAYTGIDYQTAPAALERTHNAAASPLLSPLAGFMQKSAEWCRNRELYPLVNIAKKVGLKDLIFGNGDLSDNTYTIPAEDKTWLEDMLSGEAEKLESLIGPVPEWRVK